MNGWLEALGMIHGYKNILPLVADDNYFDGYELAQFERKTNGVIYHGKNLSWLMLGFLTSTQPTNATNAIVFYYYDQ